MPSKLTQATRDDIQLQLEAGARPDAIASAFRVGRSQIYKMRSNLAHFGTVAPDPAQFQVQGRPRLINDDAREDILDFLLDHGKQAYIDEVQVFLRDQYQLEVSWSTARRLIKDLKMTKKVVSHKLFIFQL